MFFQDFLQRVKQHKSKIMTFILIVIVIAVLIILSHKSFSIILKNIQKWLNTGLYYIPSITSINIKEWSNAGFSILELLAILLAILFLVSVTLLIFYRQKNTNKKEWDIRFFDISSEHGNYAGKYISDFLYAQLIKIHKMNILIKNDEKIKLKINKIGKKMSKSKKEMRE